MGILDGKCALVTGATRGIGRGIALALARQGAKIIGTATTDAGARSIGEYLDSEGLNGRGAVLDVANSTSVDAFFGELKKNSELPGILVNNAGITRDNLFMRLAEDDWEAVINTNLSSLYRMTRPCVRSMMKARAGKIINISSVVGATGNPGQVNYAAAKAGVMGFTKALARELGPRGITVNAVAPGFIETDMTAALTEEQRTALIASVPLKKLGMVEDIAAAVVFLSSPGAGYITGETLHVNGGMHMA